MTDLEIIQRVREGDREAYSRLVDRYGPAVFNVAYHFLRNREDAADAAQDALLQGFLALNQLQDGARFAPWLRTVVMNVCRARLRQRVVTVPLEACAELRAAEGDAVERLSGRVAVEQALGCLSEQVCLTLTLFYEQRYSLEEIAAFLEVPVTTVKSRLRDGRNRLRKTLGVPVRQSLPRRPVPEDLTQQVMQLLRAAREGDVSAVVDLVESHPDLLSARDSLGNSALTEALNSGRDAVAEALFDRGARLDLHSAAATGATERVREILLAEPERIDTVSAEGFTPLSLAAHFGHWETALVLLRLGAAVDRVATHELGVTPLHSALFGQREGTALLLLEWGASVHATRGGKGLPREGWTALHYAVGYGMTRVAGALLERGADPEACDAQGVTPRALAAEGGNEALLELLSGGPWDGSEEEHQR